MGLFSNETAPVQGTLLDTIAVHLAGMISLGPDERDLVVLQHRVVAEWSDGHTVSSVADPLGRVLTRPPQETHTATLEMLGDVHGHRAMATLVGTTCGIATQLFLDGCQPLSKPGLLAPYTKEICDPIRTKLREEGISLVEEKL